MIQTIHRLSDRPWIAPAPDQIASTSSSDPSLLFDADCRIPNSTALIDWYIEHLNGGAKVADTHVAYYDFPNLLSVRVRFFVHHFIHHVMRWVKRNVLGVPAARGSNYAVHRSTMVDLYDRTFLADELNVGPVAKSMGGKVVYSGANELYVYTSGRMFLGGWLRILRYVRRRLADRVGIQRVPVGVGDRQATRRQQRLCFTLRR